MRLLACIGLIVPGHVIESIVIQMTIQTSLQHLQSFTARRGLELLTRLHNSRRAIGGESQGGCIWQVFSL